MTAMFNIAATPFAYTFPAGATALVVIDMQRDFVEPGGFGASLGNDVTLLHAAIAPIAALLAAWRERGWTIVHTREAHRPDLADCPPAKRLRGQPSLRIGDEGPMGRVLISGEPGVEIIAALAPDAGEIVVDKPGKGMFLGHRTARDAAGARHHALGLHRRDDRGLRADVDARGQRPWLRLPAGRGRHRKLLSRIQGSGAGDDRGAGRDRRLARTLRRCPRSDLTD
jgi:hypothetical protein